ncbi:MAG: 4-(cytidine 5'-diphospho)-2-C-methyl-D-erythritol kinase [Phycisphaerales bacterium]
MRPHALPNELKNASTRRARLALRAPAKVNLALAVGPPRAGDGFHPICSWMTTLSLADDLDLMRLEDDRLSRFAIVWADDAPRPSPIDWPITKDLAVRAHALLEHEAGRHLPVQMKLTKRVPVGGGLGGGSSDAAAMLVGVTALFGLGLAPARLRELAMTLGSDVAFFLCDELVGEGADAGGGSGAEAVGSESRRTGGGRSAIVEGFGERLTNVPAPNAGAGAHLVLLFPEFGCPTGAVYKAFDALGPGPLREREVHALARSSSLESGALFNDLAAAAEAVAPELGPLRRRAAEVTGLPVHVTGSGSTMFVVCESADAAARVKAALDAARVTSASSAVQAGV